MLWVGGFSLKVRGLEPQRGNRVLFSEEGGRDAGQTQQQALPTGAVAGGGGCFVLNGPFVACSTG